MTDQPLRGLGRRHAPDPRDQGYLLRELTVTAKAAARKPRINRYWYSQGWWGDQGETQQCVAYSWLHWIEDGPTTHRPKKPGTPPMFDPAAIYAEAQKVDDWPGEEPSYFGTSVRAGAKVLQSRGLISEYRWTWSVEDVIDALLYVGPVVVGTNWYRSMFTPDENGILGIAGPIDGGHAYVLNGISIPKNLIRIKNSWGRGWAQKGYAHIMPHDLQRLLNEEGECCLAVEVAT